MWGRHVVQNCCACHDTFIFYFILFYLLLEPLAIYIEPTSSSLFVAIYLPEPYVHSEVGRKLITSHHTTLHKYQPFRLDYI